MLAVFSSFFHSTYLHDRVLCAMINSAAKNSPADCNPSPPLTELVTRRLQKESMMHPATCAVRDSVSPDGSYFIAKSEAHIFINFAPPASNSEVFIARRLSGGQ